MRLLLFLLSLLSLSAQAFPLMTVEALQLPAWLERGGVRQPLLPGAGIRQGDGLVVGGGGRVWLSLSDGSRVKLGELADFRVTELGLAEAPKTTGGPSREIARQRWGVAHSGEAPPLLAAALEVAKGAFRFTTGSLGQTGRREVRIKVGAATAGIRGTDVWGKSSDEKDLICLIEGQVVVQHGTKLLSLQDPLSFFVVPRGQPPLPVGAATEEEVKKWARETELEPGAGILRHDGGWQVNLFASPERQETETIRARLAENGYGAEVVEVTVKGKRFHRLRIGGLADRAEAEGLARRLAGRYGLAAPWVSN